jgi:hypothetical protein
MFGQLLAHSISLPFPDYFDYGYDEERPQIAVKQQKLRIEAFPHGCIRVRVVGFR